MPNAAIETLRNGSSVIDSGISTLISKNVSVDYSLILLLLLVGLIIKHLPLISDKIANRCIPVILITIGVGVECALYYDYLVDMDAIMTVVTTGVCSAFAAISIHSSGKATLFNDAFLNFITGQYDESIEMAKLLKQQHEKMEAMVAANKAEEGIELDPEELVPLEDVEDDEDTESVVVDEAVGDVMEQLMDELTAVLNKEKDEDDPKKFEQKVEEKLNEPTI